MSVFVLKLIAVVSMLIDHASYVLRLSGRLPWGSLYIAARTVGRAAFLIYCFLLVNGFEKTGDRKKYLARLVMFAAISQLPFTLAFTAENYRAGTETLFAFDAARALFLALPLGVYFLTVCRRRFEPSLLWLAAAFLLASTDLTLRGVRLLACDDLNVFYTLAAGFTIMMCLESLSAEERGLRSVLPILAVLGVELYLLQRHADYGLLGVALIALLYLCRGDRLLQLVTAALWCFVEYRWCIFDSPVYLPYFIGALCTLGPIALYNGRLGPKGRAFFYLIYPAHLALLGAVFVCLSRA